MDWVPPERFDEYRLVRALGRGSMGQVWLAHDTVLDRLVAVKFIPEPARDADRQRFLTEARAAARIQHPNIIAIYRVGEIGPRPYLITEYVRGHSLDRIARPVAWPRLHDIALGLARGLAAAHDRGVLHRDLKPANAILSETGEVKLLDFGLAKLVPRGGPVHDVSSAGDPLPARRSTAPTAPPPLAAASTPDDAGNAATVKRIDASPRAIDGGGIALPELTTTGAVMGTPAYMPPEAWRGEPSTPRSDIYALGALLYELAAGVPPHRGDSQQAVRSSALETNAPPLAIAAPGIDPRFAAIIDRCLRRDPTERFASGDAVREPLEALAAGPAQPVELAEPALSPAPPDRPRPWRPALAPVTLGILGLLGVLGLGVFVRQRWIGHPVAAAAARERCPDDMITIPAGRFEMGSPDSVGDADEHPRHTVTLSPYCIDRTEVTVAAYAGCVAAGACSPPPLTVNWSSYSTDQVTRFSRWCNRSDRPDHPINCVDWNQAATYCTWRNRRLPSEAEWEYAARGSDGRVYPWGDQSPSATRLNACGTECTAMAAHAEIPWRAMHDRDDGWETTAPVGSYPDGASPFGALDMAGNVWEWTGDWYRPYAASAQTDPHGETGTSRVSRGGGWNSGAPDGARVADRDWLDPGVREAALGFRCARAH